MARLYTGSPLAPRRPPSSDSVGTKLVSTRIAVQGVQDLTLVVFSWLQRVSRNPCTADRRPERTPITMSAHDQVQNAHESLVKMTASNIEGRVDWATLGGAPTRLVAITTWARNGRHLSPSADQIWLSPCILKTGEKKKKLRAAQHEA